MQAGSALTDIGRVIQLSVAPVFLITGIGGLLSVLSGRLGRTIDRSRRAKLIDQAMTLATTSALVLFLREVFLATRALRIQPR
jgi:hypothetical protein